MILLFTLFVTIVVHEFGHLIMAKLLGVRVEAFSIGFGKILLHKKLFGIDWRLSLLPFGGYCKLEGEDKETKTGLLVQPYWKKFLILIAGVGFNFLLISLLYKIYYGSVLFGFKFDWNLGLLIIAKKYEEATSLYISVNPNILISSITIFGLFTALSNLLPIPPLDGGYLWVYLLQKIFKDKFINILKLLNIYGIIFLIIIQFIIVWYWLI